jgi:hypothetical protein
MSTAEDDESAALTHFSGMSEASRQAAIEKEAVAEAKRQEVGSIIILTCDNLIFYFHVLGNC